MPTPQQVARHLGKRDAALKPVIAKIGALDVLGPEAAGRPSSHFGALLRAIVGQQLSTHAARAIYNRLAGFFNDQTPTAEQLLAIPAETLRERCGLSRPKVSYLYSLAEHTVSGQLKLERLDDLPDEEVIAELIAVRGLGEWTAHMFLIFHLARPDVLATGDLGIRKAVKNLYNLPDLPDPAAMKVIAEPWRPHRSTACRYLWRSLDEK